MTFREKLNQEHPEVVAETTCPARFGYEQMDCSITCTECWDREMPTVDTKSETSMSGKETIEQALKILYGDRMDAYGDPKESHERIARYWSLWLGTELTAHDVAMMMILFKISREQNDHKNDNMVDVIGYASIVNEIETERL